MLERQVRMAGGREEGKEGGDGTVQARAWLRWFRGTAGVRPARDGVMGVAVNQVLGSKKGDPGHLPVGQMDVRLQRHGVWGEGVACVWEVL